MPLIGSRLSHYEILAKLGEGGMGEVYLAEDTRLGRKVALKVLPEAVAHDPERLRRLEREARALGALDHANIVTVYSVEEADGVRFLTMAYVEGRTLDELIPGDGLPVARLVEMATALAAALAAAHEKGVVHRDLKPANVMVDTSDRLRVLDFGLAKLVAEPSAAADAEQPTRTLSEEGLVVGTVPYMSPEQLEGRPVDARSDLFSLGAMLHEMATGHRPFRGDSAMSVASAILRDEPPSLAAERPDLPPRLRNLIESCLRKEPGARVQTAGELMTALGEIHRDLDSMAMAATTVAPSPPPTSPTRQRASRGPIAGLLIAAVAVGAIALDLGGVRQRLFGGGVSGGGDDAIAPIRSLAVLPLANLSGDPDQEYFADGMTEALLTDLARIEGLKVISRTSVMRYKNSGKSLPEIAGELDVEAIVEGSIVREANRVRVTAQLIHAASDRHLWAESFDREIASILALQSELARTIAAAIQLELSPEVDSHLSAARAVDPAAYEHYLRGMYHLNRGTPEGVTLGLDHLQRAIADDPASADAYAGLALGYSIAAHGPNPPDDAFGLAAAAANRALELDETTASAHAALAMIHLYQNWDWEAAGAAFERALELDSSLAEPRAHYSWYLQLMGRDDEALAEMSRVREIDPLSPLWPAWRAWQLAALERWEEALADARSALELRPDFPVGLLMLGDAHAGMGKWDEAVAAHARLAELSPTWRYAIALTSARMGRTEEARRLAAEIAATATPWDTLFLAGIHAELGDREEALDWLEAAFSEPHHPYAPWIDSTASLDSLHEHPRYLALQQRLALPAEALRPARSRR